MPEYHTKNPNLSAVCLWRPPPPPGRRRVGDGGTKRGSGALSLWVLLVISGQLTLKKVQGRIHGAAPAEGSQTQVPFLIKYFLNSDL